MSAVVFGATGLCGRAIVEQAIALLDFNQVTSVTRREIQLESPKLTLIVEPDTNKYGEILKAAAPDAVFTGLATTRGAAGSAAKFVDIDYGINYKIAEAAKEAGVSTFVIVSSMGANPLSPFLYFKTKGRLEKDVIDLKFPRTIILRPGALIGERETSKGFLNDITAKISTKLRGVPLVGSIFNATYGKEVGQVAVHLAAKPLKDAPEVVALGGDELVKLASNLVS